MGYLFESEVYCGEILVDLSQTGGGATQKKVRDHWSSLYCLGDHYRCAFAPYGHISFPYEVCVCVWGGGLKSPVTGRSLHNGNKMFINVIAHFCDRKINSSKLVFNVSLLDIYQ